MRITICDDDQKHCRTVAEKINNYCIREKLSDVQIYQFYSSMELLENYPKQTDLLFLDIQMPGIDGIEAAREIRKFDAKVVIIFMTNYAEYAIEGYSVQAYNYLLKPVTTEILERELQGAFHLYERNQGIKITVKGDDGFYSLTSGEIEMVETQGKKVVIHTKEKSMVASLSMKKMEELLAGGEVYRIHTAFLISFHAVAQIKKESVLLQSGKELPLSRHRKKEFMKKYMEYIGGMV